jgi:mitogen-activated protein kinase kinase
MNQLELKEELGRGNYGTVKRVLHKPTNVEMAMKVRALLCLLAWTQLTSSADSQEIRLQLDNSGLQAILMELDILHNSALCPQIVEFYGAFFIESCVYYCMEYMNAGSLDKLVNVPAGHSVIRIRPPAEGEEGSAEEELKWEGVPEEVLAQVSEDMVRGLKFLKEQFNVMHRDVKPTNVLVNIKGQIKLCDFGVSGQLNQSLAKTNIGCQSYMAVGLICYYNTQTEDLHHFYVYSLNGSTQSPNPMRGLTLCLLTYGLSVSRSSR